MAAQVNTNDLRENLVNISRTVPEPEWDFLVYCRFLAKRLPDRPLIEAAEFGRLADDLIADLKEGVDRTTSQTFEPPLVSGRSDLLYNFIRQKLRLAAEKIGGPEFAAAVETGPPIAGVGASAPTAAVEPSPAKAAADTSASTAASEPGISPEPSPSSAG